MHTTRSLVLQGHVCFSARGFPELPYTSSKGQRAALHTSHHTRTHSTQTGCIDQGERAGVGE